MLTLKDVAKAAGVSTATVSHVLNGTKKLSPETVERVLKVIQEMGYLPNNLAKSLRRGKTMIVGVLVEDIRGLPVPDIVCGIGDRLKDDGYKMLLYDLHLMEKLHNRNEDLSFHRRQIEDGFAALQAARVDGLIYVGMQDIPLMYRIRPMDKPLVFAYSHVTQDDCYVTYDNLEATGQLIRYLIDRGHSRIAVISGHPHSYPTTMRMYGYCRAMHDAGLSIPDGYIHYGDWSFESGYREAKKLLAASPRPTAIFAMNDSMAAGCIHALTEEGVRVPEDVSVIGFENHVLASYIKPMLTTAAIPTLEIGKQAASYVLERIQSAGSAPEHKILPCTLVERSSVGNAPS